MSMHQSKYKYKIMAEINTSPSGKKKHTNHKSRNRRSTRVDLTPMVDLGFLLITFFVFTTSMAEPKVMTLIQPIDGPPKDTKASGVMTLIISKNHEIYYYYGSVKANSTVDAFKKTDLKNVRQIIVNKKNQTAIDDLMYIIKSDDNSSFGNNIDILDEMAICNIPAGHFSELDITPGEKDLIKRLE